MFAKQVPKNVKKAWLMNITIFFINLLKIFRETEDHILLGQKDMKIKILGFFLDSNYEGV